MQSRNQLQQWTSANRCTALPHDLGETFIMEWRSYQKDHIFIPPNLDNLLYRWFSHSSLTKYISNWFCIVTSSYLFLKNEPVKHRPRPTFGRFGYDFCHPWLTVQKSVNGLLAEIIWNNHHSLKCCQESLPCMRNILKYTARSAFF